MKNRYIYSPVLVALSLGGVALIFAKVPPLKKSSNQKSSASESAVTCTLQKVMDPVAGVPAITYLLPDGWEDSSKFNWNTNQGGITASTCLIFAHTPDKKYISTVFLDIPISFMYSPNTQPIGYPLTKATDFGRHFLETLVKGGWTDIKVVKETNVDTPENAMQKMMDRSASNGGMERVYPLHQFGTFWVQITNPAGIRCNLKIFGHIDGDFSSFGKGKVSGGNWRASPMMEILTPVDASPHAQAAAWAPIQTFSMTPEENAYGALVVKENNKVMAHQFSFGEQMKWHASQMKDFEAKMQGKDAISHNFGNYILGKADYQTPSGEILNLQDHGQAWKQGNKILYSDDPTFDPRNFGKSYSDWTPLKKVVVK